jgi:hypothetical protein
MFENAARAMVKKDWAVISAVSSELLKWKWLSMTMLDDAMAGRSGPLRTKATQAVPRLVSRPPTPEEPEPGHPPIGAMIFEPRR